MNKGKILDIIDIEDKTVCVHADEITLAMYFPESNRLFEFAIETLSEEDKDALDSVFHSFEVIIGEQLKDSLKVLVSANVITGISDLTDKLYSLEVLQHIVDENKQVEVEVNKSGMFTEPRDHFIAVVKKAGELLSSMTEEQKVMLLDRIEGPLTKVLVQMELEGIEVDKNYLDEMGEEIEGQIIKIGGKISSTFGELALNLNSPKQIAYLLFTLMKIPVKDKWKTPKGAVSVAANVIEEIAEENPQVREILEYRELVKIKGTFINGLVSKLKDGKVHATFNQTGTVTGRLSSMHPNLQNQPTGTKYDIRRAFHPKKGYSFIDADYSQIELRLLAHFSGDERLIQAFNDGRDIHQETADKLGITRAQAKGINFGIIYGMSSYGFADTMKVSVDEAKAFIKKYFDTFPKVKEFISNTKKGLAEQGYGETVFGRRRHFPEYKTAEFAEKNRIERQVVNARIQGTAADVMKIALSKVAKAISHFDARILVTVHDELIIEVNDNQLDEVKQIVKEAMEIKGFRVKLLTDIKTSKRWTK